MGCDFLLGDSLDIMKSLPDKSVDIVVTSPPYNIRNSTGGGLKTPQVSGKWKNSELSKGYDQHADNMPYDEYVAWQRECLNEMWRLKKTDGAIFYNHKPRGQNSIWQTRMDIVEGFPLRQMVIWKRSGGINFTNKYYLPSYEIIFILAESEFCISQEATSLTDVWSIHQETNNKHPAPFPERLVENCLISKPDAHMVLDPFGGSGTTSLVATRMGMNSIYIDKSNEYLKLAQERVNSSLFS